MNLFAVNWPAVVAACVARGYVKLPPPGPSPKDKLSTPRVKQWRDRREYQNQHRAQTRAAFIAQGLTSDGKVRVRRVIPELAGLTGREKHRVYMQLKRHGKI